MKKKKIYFKLIKKFVKLLLILALFGIVYSFSFSLYEYIHVEITINNFKKRAGEIPIHKEEFNYSNNTIERHYYSVPRETSYEKDGRNVMNSDLLTKNSSELPNLTYKGDIFVGRQSAFPDIPVIHQFVTLYFGGHAAIADEDGYLYEAFGFPNAGESIFDYISHDGSKPSPYTGIGVNHKQKYNYWINPGTSLHEYYGLYYKTHFSILRAKDGDMPVSDEFIDEVIDYVDSIAKDKKIYNFLFFLDMKGKYYCTDLVSRAYDYVYSGTNTNLYAKSLNDDGFITSMHDLILSKQTYMALHFEVERINDTHYIEKYFFLEQI